MAPLGRKKKPSKSSATNNKAEPEACPSRVPLPAERSLEEPSPSKDEDDDKNTPNRNSQSWYSRTWPRKVAPITQIAPESISSASNAISETTLNTRSGSNTSSKSSSSPSLQLTRKPSRALPADATTTVVNAVSGNAASALPTSETKNTSEESTTESTEPHFPRPLSNDDAQKSSDPSKTQETDGPKTSPEHKVATNTATVGWLGWLSRSTLDSKSATNENSTREQQPPAELVGIEEQERSMKDTDSDQTDPAQHTDPKNLNRDGEQSSGDVSASKADAFHQNGAKPPKRTWLQMFSNSSADADKVDQGTAGPQETPNRRSIQISSTVEACSEAPSLEASPPPNLPGDGKSSGWAFWSRDRKSNSTNTASDSHVGELAISNTPSQKRPKRASISLEKPVEASPEPTKPKKLLNTQQPKQGESQQALPISKEKQPKDSKEPKKEPSTTTLAKAQDIEIASRALQNAIPNQTLPSFQDTFLLPESPTLMQQLARLIGYSKSPEPRHLHLVRDPPRIKNALAIGVHGYFPAPLLRTMLGQPTGTSIKFADMATKAIRRWTASRGYDCEVKSAALEGEGRIGERVALLWKLLLNWIDEIRKSDFILIACHSQGVPVALMLVAKLISFGCVSAAKVGVCAMAGVNLGPFPDYKSRWIGGSAGELFEFSNTNSTVSKDLLASLETCLRFGVRITYVGSIDDQLVSLEVCGHGEYSGHYLTSAVFNVFACLPSQYLPRRLHCKCTRITNYIRYKH